ncbi:hypothetical protein [Bacillus sp. B-jedd]|uniref:hypothetical protein n=1 Tax=Bacillus sp. B-jedd TaxID=1476857 RepID=UPI00051566A9|nr:hypothetical protein [Bacillus sp. B-jedd]CEG28116.1 hypothetical protein BN1002_02995 [Bacillus sp. B-jedd]
MSKLKEVDVEISEVGEKYGEKFAELIAREIESCLSYGIAYRVHLKSDSRYFQLLFITESYFKSYDVFPQIGTVDEKTIIGRVDAKIAIQIMDELNKNK